METERDKPTEFDSSVMRVSVKIDDANRRFRMMMPGVSVLTEILSDLVELIREVHRAKT